MSPRLKLYASVASIGLTWSTVGVAHAQDVPASTTPAPSAGSTTTDEANDIVVTAQRRAENVQKVPVAVTVISGDQLARRGTQSIQDLSQASASLEFTAPGAAPGGGGFVRGIGTNQVGNATAASSVSVVLDGVVLGNANISDIFDTERVEVLKGPQGTLFGSSVSAGVLNITTRAPRIDEASGYISGEFGIRGLGAEYSRSALRGAVNIPVSKTSALRVAGYFYNNNGLSVDRSNGKINDQANFGFRARYLWEITDNLTFNLIGDYNRAKTTNGTGFIWRAAMPGSLLDQALRACGITPSPRNTDNCAGFPNATTSDIGGVSGQFDLKLGSATLTSISSYRKVTGTNLADIISLAPSLARQYLQNCDFVTCSPVVQLTSGVPGDPERSRQTLVTQEIRLASESNRQFEWVLGAYFQRATFFDRQHAQLIAHPAFLGFDIVLGEGVAITNSSSTDYAVFGNGTYYLGESTRLIAGARFTHSRVSETKADPINSGVPTAFSLQTDANALTWRAGIQHDLSKHTMLYATISTGYKAPQINDTLTTTTHFLSPVKPERPISYEVGLKQSFLGGRLNFAADAFYTVVNDFQTQSCLPGANGIVCTNLNVPRVKSKGVEFELFGRVSQYTTVNLSGIYNDATYPKGFTGADLSDLSGHQLNYAPKYKATISIEQEIPLTDRYSLVLGGDATARAKQSMYLSANPKYVIPAQTLVNLRFGLKSKDNWSIALFARNLTNKIYPTQLYPSDAFARGGLWQILDPNSQRMVGFQFEAHF